MIKAIQTQYSNVLFRSRIEARWAVFFDLLGLPWQYELECFEFDGVRYLPDFWLPRQKKWVEIKGSDFKTTSADGDKVSKFATAIGEVVYVFAGGIPNVSGDLPENDLGSDWAFAMFPHDGEDVPHYFCQCSRCGEYGIEYMGRSERIKCCPKGADPRREFTAMATTIQDAYIGARSARFEHGESGATIL